MNSRIEAISHYLPEVVIDNEFLMNNCEVDKFFLEEKIGIMTRRIARPDETTSDMAVNACKKIFLKYPKIKDNIDLLIFCTQNPDYKLPTTACILQDKLKLNTSIKAFDINLGCSGYIYSMVIADSFIKNLSSHGALLVMADQYSKIIDYKDKNTASLFGDAATATILIPNDENYGMIDYDLGTDGSGAGNLIAFNSGVAKDIDKSPYIYMNGREIFKFSITVVPDSVNRILKRNNLSINNIKYFIFHQANKYMLTEIGKKLQLLDNQLIIDMSEVGNTVSSTIPLILEKMYDQHSLKKGDLIILSGFGVGLSWGTILYKC